MSGHTKTLKVRVKDKHIPLLNNMARSVNFVNELSQRSIKERGVFLSAYDIQKYTNGAGKDLGLHSQTVQRVAVEYTVRRKQFKKARLNWRKSCGVRRSLGWIPVNTAAAQWKNGQVYHNGHYFSVWDSYGLNQYKFRSGSFNEDARGRWYFNVVVDVEATTPAGQDRIGIDLGLATTATCSDGETLEASRFYRGLESKLAVAQRARNKQRVKTIHAKIANRRKDSLHKYSRKLVNRCGEIYVGNVSSLKLVKTKMAKSVLDAGWGQLKTMLEYKCDVRRDVALMIVAGNATYFSMNSTLSGHASRVIALYEAPPTMCQTEMSSQNRKEVDKCWKHHLAMALGYPSRLTYVNTY